MSILILGCGDVLPGQGCRDLENLICWESTSLDWRGNPFGLAQIFRGIFLKGCSAILIVNIGREPEGLGWWPIVNIGGGRTACAGGGLRGAGSGFLPGGVGQARASVLAGEQSCEAMRGRTACTYLVRSSPFGDGCKMDFPFWRAVPNTPPLRNEIVELGNRNVEFAEAKNSTSKATRTGCRACSEKSEKANNHRVMG